MPHRGKALLFLLLAEVLGAFEGNVTVSSTAPHVGEPVLITYAFARQVSEEVLDLRFAAPSTEHLQILRSGAEETIREGSIIRTQHIVAVPLQPGALRVGEASVYLAARTYEKDAWGQWMPAVKWTSYPFDALTLNVLPLPPGIDAVGRFTMHASVDRETVDGGAPVVLHIAVSGCGNLEAAELPFPAVAGVNVFEGETARRGAWREGCYESELNRTLTLVGARDFTVPSLGLHTFDPALGEIVPVRTAPIEIHVRTVRTDESGSENEEETMTIGMAAAAAAAGFGAGVAATLLWLRRRRPVRRAQNDSVRSLLVALFRHLDAPEAQRGAEAVEKHLYEGAEAPDTRQLNELLARLKGPRREG